MKLLFENWRRYIKEARPQPLQQRILHDIGGYSGGVTRGRYDDEKTFRDKQKPSVGYGADEDLIKDVKLLMEETPQDWMFITAQNVGAVGVFANKKDQEDFQNWFDGWIKEWLKERNKPENFLDDTIFLVIQSAPLKGDSTGAQWLIHDIIGHSIYSIYESTPSNYKPYLDFDFLNYVQQQLKPQQKTNDSATAPNKFAAPATADFDRLPDVFAAIILGNLGKKEEQAKEKMKEYGKNYLDSNKGNAESVDKTITEIFKYTNRWVNKILKRGPKNLNFVELWNPNDPNDK